MRRIVQHQEAKSNSAGPGWSGGARTIAQFAVATLVLSVLGYVIKGRGLGLAFWQVLLAFAVFAAATMLLRFLIERMDRWVGRG
ncbi:MAG: hypothetical protein ACRD12_20700 [Acidimicrobiales bacterium]